MLRRVPPSEPIVGRARDLAAVGSCLAAEARLVTVTGPGGMGKTRLAQELARRLVAEGLFPAACFAELAGARDPAALCDAVAAALGAAGEAGRGADPVARVGKALAARGPALVVLDDFDAAVAHAGATVGRWLALAPEASFLVTSRERLALDGEVVHELGPLALPEGDAAIASAEAVDLFVRCARRLRHDFTLAEADAPFVAEIVRALDGMPLAIELAAARTAVMGPRALLHRLRSRFEVLRRTHKRGPDRHATLEAAIDGSWQALAPAERDALAQCTVFRGGFTLEAAEAVIDLAAHPGAPPAMDVIAALRDKSLVVALPGPRGDLRLGLYASIREYAARALDPAATAAVEARHAAHAVRSAEALAARVAEPEARSALLAERENLLAVIERVLGRGPVTARTAEPALRALVVLAPLLEHDGPLESYVRLLDPVLDATQGSGADPALIGRALAVRGRFRWQRGDDRGGARDLVRALAIARPAGDARLEARVLHDLGHALAARGDLAAARDHLEQALALTRQAADRREVGRVLASLGALAAREGRATEAVALLERARAAHEAEHSAGDQATDRRLLGAVWLDQGRVAEARGEAMASRQLAAAAGDARAEAMAASLVGLCDHAAGDLASARAAYTEAAAALSAMGHARLAAIATGHLGALAREEGRAAEAYTLLGEACDALGDEAEAAVFHVHRAALDVDAGRARDARAGLDRARSAAQRAGDRALLAVIAREDARLAGAPSPATAADAQASAAAWIAWRCGDRAATAAPPPPAEALVIGAGGLWFRPPHAERVSLDRRRQLAVLLDRLAAERRDRPGAPLAWQALLAAGWPGERVLPEAGAHRVRVALSTLRKLGLRDVIKTAGDGYLLDPAVPAILSA
jgi:predicted ATPase